MSTAERSPQAAYQAKRRAKNPPVTFFPDDRDRLRVAVRVAGRTQEEWLREAVREKIEREIQELVNQARTQFRSTCFWNVRLTGDVDQDLPIVFQRLRKYGGAAGWRVAADLLDLAGEERVQWH